MQQFPDSDKDDQLSDETEMHVDVSDLRAEIQDYYLPTQLVDAIERLGGIPSSSEVTTVGVAFLDIADYTYLSQFLSPQENQDLLNGLYTAFAGVLNNHGGYLNKIEGDSIMFHYGGSIDPAVRDLSAEDAERYIARELFYSCVEMQRVCAMFNIANEKFLGEGASEESKTALRRAFDIISALRSNFEAAKAINALFQIRIRIGANIGPVTIGNFGPDGAKQWDVVGTAVIDAKRMESTAPIGGLRISHALYEKLMETGIADAYFQRFRREALVLGSYYRDITREELFKGSTVLLKDKKSATFETYSVQVTPNLPESIALQVKNLLAMGESGASKIIDLLKYYRGNPYVMNAIEDAFSESGVVLRKRYMLEAMYPLQLRAIREQYDNDIQRITEHVNNQFSLYQILDKLGVFQDLVKENATGVGGEPQYSNYDQYMEHQETVIRGSFERNKAHMERRAYFFNVMFPLVFASIRSSIYEYQTEAEDLETLAGA